MMCYHRLDLINLIILQLIDKISNKYLLKVNLLDKSNYKIKVLLIKINLKKYSFFYLGKRID